MGLANKTLFITGGSRGIGLAIALRAARDGANIAIAPKTAEPHPKLAGTIYSAAQEIEDAGGKALPLQVDIRDAAAVQAAVQRTAEVFGGIDICVNNASAINLSTTETIDIARFDLHDVRQDAGDSRIVDCEVKTPEIRESARDESLRRRTAK